MAAGSRERNMVKVRQGEWGRGLCSYRGLEEALVDSLGVPRLMRETEPPWKLGGVG